MKTLKKIYFSLKWLNPLRKRHPLVVWDLSNTLLTFRTGHKQGLLWSHGSWICNYLCNQCLSLLMLWVQIPLRQGVMKFVCDLQQVGGFLWVLRFPPPINWPQQYNWNIVESGIKHHVTLDINKCLVSRSLHIKNNLQQQG